MEVFNEDYNYVKDTMDHKRENYKEYLEKQDRCELFQLLADNIKGSPVKTTRWDIQAVAEILVNIKYGNEKED